MAAGLHVAVQATAWPAEGTPVQIYGDIRESLLVSEALERLGELVLLPGGSEPHPIERRGRQVLLLVEAGRLAQGLLDAWEMEGQDAPVKEKRTLTNLLLECAGAVTGRSSTHWPAVRPLRMLGSLPPSMRIDLISPAGYERDAIYPEGHLEAGRRLAGVSPLTVVGIRSIGTSLGAAVATGAGTKSLLTVRTLPPGPRLTTELLGKRKEGAGVFAIAGEGPERVADWLVERGVARRIVLVPTHGGEPGAAVPFEELFLGIDTPPPLRLSRWFEDLTGPAEAPLEDLGCGRWRRLLFRDEGAWPAAQVLEERRKYLLEAEGRRWLLKFAGLTLAARDKLQRARELHAHGFGPETPALRHGFLLSSWISAQTLATRRVPHADLVDFLARYLRLLSRTAPASGGASPAELLAAARQNTAEALGEDAAGALDLWREHLPALTGDAQPVWTDGRLLPHELLVTDAGRLLKADALDHALGPGLVGSQDIAWDVAGATVELGLGAADVESLARSVAGPAAGRLLGRLGFYAECYLGWRVGETEAARASLSPEHAAEAGRFALLRDRYAGLLSERIAREGRARREIAVPGQLPHGLARLTNDR